MNPSQYRAELLQFSEACAGSCEVFVVARSTIPELVSKVSAGDPSMLAVLAATRKWFTEASRKVCLDCDTTFSPTQPPCALTVAVPYANPIATLVAGVCEACIARGDLRETVLRRYRELFPDAFEIVAGGMQ